MSQAKKPLAVYQALADEDKKKFVSYIRNLRPKLYPLLKYIAKFDLNKQNIKWEKYLDTEKQTEIPNLKNISTDLLQELNQYLLQKQQNQDTKNLNEIALCYLYRDLGLIKESEQLLNQIKRNMSEHSFYTRYAFSQIKAGIELFTKDFSERDISDTQQELNNYWLSESFVYECIRKKTEAKSDLEIAKERYLQALIETYEQQTAKDEALEVYLQLYRNTQSQREGKMLSAENLTSLGESVRKLLRNLPQYRARDIFTIFYNLVVTQYNRSQEWQDFELFEKYTTLGFTEKWHYIGNTLTFEVYRNLMLCYMRGKEDGVEKNKRIRAAQKAYQEQVKWRDSKGEKLLALQLSFYTVPFISNEEQAINGGLACLYHDSLNTFVEHGREKYLAILVAFKAALTLFNRNELNYAIKKTLIDNDNHDDNIDEDTFWLMVKDICRKKQYKESLQGNPLIEFEIWRNMSILYFNITGTKREKARDFLQQQKEELSNSSKVRNDPQWYIAQINSRLST